MGARQKRRFYSKLVIACYVGFVAVMVLYGYLANPSISNSRVTVDSEFKQVYDQGDEITIAGRILGGAAVQAIVFDPNTNIGVDAKVSAGAYGVSIPANSLGHPGWHRIGVVAKVEQNGRTGWTEPSYVDINTENTNEPSALTAFRNIFKPVTAPIANFIGVFVEGGTDPADLNGDNYADVLEMTPVQPAHQAVSNFPLVFVSIIMVIAVVVVYAFSVEPTGWLRGVFAQSRRDRIRIAEIKKERDIALKSIDARRQREEQNLAERLSRAQTNAEVQKIREIARAGAQARRAESADVQKSYQAQIEQAKAAAAMARSREAPRTTQVFIGQK